MHRDVGKVGESWEGIVKIEGTKKGPEQGPDTGPLEGTRQNSTLRGYALATSCIKFPKYMIRQLLGIVVSNENVSHVWVSGCYSTYCHGR